MDLKRVVIIDDHDIIRIGIRAMLMTHGHPDYQFDIVHEAADGHDGWRAVQAIRPDIVLLDIELPGMNGYELLRRVKAMPDAPKVIMLSRHAGTLPVRRAHGARADGFAFKSDRPDVLIKRIASALRGTPWQEREWTYALGRRIWRHVASTPLSAPSTSPNRDVVVTSAAVERDIDTELAMQRGLSLTARERLVADHLITGNTNKAIARLLCLSAKTISAHKRNIFRKLAVTSLIEMADCLRETDSYGVRCRIPGNAGGDAGNSGRQRHSAIASITALALRDGLATECRPRSAYAVTSARWGLGESA